MARKVTCDGCDREMGEGDWFPSEIDGRASVSVCNTYDAVNTVQCEFEVKVRTVPASIDLCRKCVLACLIKGVERSS